MIKSFIKEFPEEVFYSIIARYYKHTLSFSPKRFSQQLFNSSLGAATIDLPSHLESFHSNTILVFPYTPDDIIEKFTLYPFYFPFLKIAKRTRIISSMKGNEGNTIHTRLGINASMIATYRYPRYCPACIEESILEPYWERLAQTDLIICPKHNCFIHSYRPSAAELNRSLFISAPKDLHIHNPPVFNHDKKLYALAKIYQKILLKEYDFDINQINYLEKIREGGYIKQSNLDVQKITIAFKRFHSQEFLTRLFPGLKEDVMCQWLPDIIKRPFHIFHPLRHILVNEFVKSIEVTPKMSNRPFGPGPWPCINKASNHLNENVINTLDYHIDLKTKRLIGVLSCVCGMVYTKSVLTKNGKSIEFIRVKEWGRVWTKKLKEELQTGKSFRTIAALLGTDAKTVSRFSNEFSQPIAKKVHSKESKKCLAYRNRWEKLLNKFSFQRVYNARLIAPKIYSWLYRNDNLWLLTVNKLHSQGSGQAQLKLDWEQLDKDLIIKLSVSLKKLKQEGFKGRISKTLLAKIINHEKYLLGKNVRMLPLSRKYLDKVCESREEYQIKRIKLVKKELDDKLEIALEWKIMRRAGLRKELSPAVKEEIKNIIGY